MPTAKNKKRGSRNSKRSYSLDRSTIRSTIKSTGGPVSQNSTGYQSVKEDTYREYVLFLHSLTDNEITRDSDD